MENKIRIGVIGSGKGINSLNRSILEKAVEVGKLIARKKAILICGGLGGVMEAVAMGAKKEKGITIGILPYNNIKRANPYIDYPIATGMGEARNILVVKNSDVLIAIDGGYGTLSEIAFALKLGKPVIGIDTWNLKEKADIIICKSSEEAVQKAFDTLKKRA